MVMRPVADLPRPHLAKALPDSPENIDFNRRQLIEIVCRDLAPQGHLVVFLVGNPVLPSPRRRLDIAVDQVERGGQDGAMRHGYQPVP